MAKEDIASRRTAPYTSTPMTRMRTILAAAPVALLPLGAPHAANGPCVIFFEGNTCSQGRSSCCTIAGHKMDGCWKNDEARSIKVYGPPGTVVAVFDSPDASTADDYFVLEKHRPEPVCVSSLEVASVSLEGSGHTWFYSGGNGLEGKVSSMRWYDPRKRRGGTP